MGSVSLKHDQQVATVTIHNPAKKNALSFEATKELRDHLHEVQYDDDVRCVVVTGEGDSFCAGAEVGGLAEVDFADHAAGIEQRFHEVVYTLMRMKKPVVAKVRGPAVGAGASLATACDFAYSSPDARFGWVFSNIGVSVDSGASFILPRLVGARTAMELLASGELIGAEEACELGITNDVVDDLDEFVAARAHELSNGPTRALGEMKRMLLRGTHRSLEEVLDAEATSQTTLRETHDRKEGMAAFLEKRKPEFEGR